MKTLLFNFEPGVIPEAELDRVRAAAPDMRLRVTRDRDEIAGFLDEIEIAANGLPRDLLSQARSLRWVQQWSAGVDWLLRHPEIAELDFVLTNVSGIHAIPVSEHILAFLLAFGRGFHHALRAQVRHEWFSYEQQAGIFELAGKTMVLVGVGAIGRRTAKLATALGMRVLGVRRDPTVGAPGVEAMYGPDQLLDLLPEADFLVLVVPLTHETQGMIGERELRAMKPTAHVVNVGRGGLIQEDVLIQALREGWIAGAGLDVFAQEPLASDSPLWGMGNVILTPHIAGMTPHYNERAADLFALNLRRYLSGRPLLNQVDLVKGY